jgi:excisionase family DNA binding protein
MPDKEFISIPEAAQLLFVSRSHVARLISNGKLTAQPDGRIRMSDVLEYKSIKQAEAKTFLETHTEAEHTEAQHGQAEPPELTISFYNGEYMDDPAALTYQRAPESGWGSRPARIAVGRPRDAP